MLKRLITLNMTCYKLHTIKVIESYWRVSIHLPKLVCLLNLKIPQQQGGKINDCQTRIYETQSHRNTRIASWGLPISQEKKCPECSTWIDAHTEGPAWFVMCNMCVMMTEI